MGVSMVVSVSKLGVHIIFHLFRYLEKGLLDLGAGKVVGIVCEKLLLHQDKITRMHRIWRTYQLLTSSRAKNDQVHFLTSSYQIDHSNFAVFSRLTALFCCYSVCLLASINSIRRGKFFIKFDREFWTLLAIPFLVLCFSYWVLALKIDFVMDIIACEWFNLEVKKSLSNFNTVKQSLIWP